MFFFVRWVIYANTTYILQKKYFREFVKTWNLVKAVNHTIPSPLALSIFGLRPRTGILVPLISAR